MRKLTLTSVFLLGLALVFSSPVAAQEDQDQDDDQADMLRLSFYQCDLSRIGPAMEQIESMEIPIWEELIDEGMVESYGTFIHAWADEWNVGIYTVAESIQAVVDATAEFGVRMQERHPDADSGLNQICPTHRDGFYITGPSTGDDDDDSDG